VHISVIGLWRDAGKYIERTLKQLENLLKLNEFNFTFYFYENDSTDNTKSVLESWCKNKSATLLSEHLSLPKYGSVEDVNRLILLSLYRNKLKRMMSQEKSDLTLMIDTDIIFTSNDFLDLFNNMKSLDATMVCANVRQYGIKDCLMDQDIKDSFYDVFALRDRYNNNCIYFADCPMVLADDRALWINNKPVRINSGFSGFSLIKTQVLQQCNWSTCQHSEHVNFCTEVLRYGDIYIIPSCKPISIIDTSTITPAIYERVKQQQKAILKHKNDNYLLSLQTNLSVANSEK
jgi:Cryptococcal mannosyltransferase 1